LKVKDEAAEVIPPPYATPDGVESVEYDEIEGEGEVEGVPGVDRQDEEGEDEEEPGRIVEQLDSLPSVSQSSQVKASAPRVLA
jgi:hypothetical protein